MPPWLPVPVQLEVPELRLPAPVEASVYFFCTEALTNVARHVQRKASPLDELTPRERQVLALIAEGQSNGGIASELVVTVAAVERHVTSIFDKLGLNQAADGHRRVLAVLTYLRA